MGHYNAATNEFAAKIVYLGPACSGKTENLQCIHRRMAPSVKHEMISLKTDTERTLYFDMLPVSMGLFRRVKLRYLLYSVPGQLFYNEARKLVLRDADALVFVVDSQRTRFQENLDCIGDMSANLKLNGLDPETIPLAIQFNKRDLPNVTPVHYLNEVFNTRNVPCFEAVASQGIGVLETFKHISKKVLNQLTERHRDIFGIQQAAS